VVDGKTYALTKDYATVAVFYNKDLFRAAHVPFPKPGWTWNDLLQDARKLTVVKGGRTVQWGINLPGNWLRGTEPLIHDFGGSTISPDGKKIEGYLNSPRTVKAVQFYVDMYNKYHVAPSPAEQKAFANLDMFSGGKVAMNMTGPWEITTWLQNKNFHFDVVPMPSYNGKAYTSICWAGFAMNARTSQKEAAWQVIKALGGRDGSMVFAQWALPAVKSVAAARHIDREPYRSVFLKAVKDVPGKPDTMLTPDGGAALDDPWTKAIEHLLAHPGTSVKATLDQTARTSQQELDNFLSGSGP
jgi:multiple sugar transport system substrate-binding protein